MERGARYNRIYKFKYSEGAFLVTDDRVFNGPLGHSLRSFARTSHSAHSLRSALLHYASGLTCSVHGLAHSLCSLPRGTVEIFEYMFTLWSRFTGTNAFFIFTRNTPWRWQRIFLNKVYHYLAISHWFLYLSRWPRMMMLLGSGPNAPKAKPKSQPQCPNTSLVAKIPVSGPKFQSCGLISRLNQPPWL